MHHDMGRVAGEGTQTAEMRLFLIQRGWGSEVLTLFGADIWWDVWRVWSWIKVLVAVGDERGERVDRMGWLHHGHFIWLQRNHKDSS